MCKWGIYINGYWGLYIWICKLPRTGQGVRHNEKSNETIEPIIFKWNQTVNVWQLRYPPYLWSTGVLHSCTERVYCSLPSVPRRNLCISLWEYFNPIYGHYSLIPAQTWPNLTPLPNTEWSLNSCSIKTQTQNKIQRAYPLDLDDVSQSESQQETDGTHQRDGPEVFKELTVYKMWAGEGTSVGIMEGSLGSQQQEAYHPWMQRQEAGTGKIWAVEVHPSEAVAFNGRRKPPPHSHVNSCSCPLL